ncbi:MAG: ATP-dependent zinc metalloprotease FtsH [Chloroflexota bacterium]|nr:MAG: ATP-dependent zinc metalloprotease FtsH [Chloroflexota bacterium]
MKQTPRSDRTSINARLFGLSPVTLGATAVSLSSVLMDPIGGNGVAANVRLQGMLPGGVISSWSDAAASMQAAQGFDWGWILLPSLGLLALSFLAMFFFMARQPNSQGGTNQVMSFTRSHARKITAMQQKVTFEDVAGVDEAKLELQEVVEFLKFPAKFAAVGARIPRGMLLVGPPGTGKTLMARAVAGEAGVPFFSISGSEFVELFAGVGASRVRDLFNQAKESAPCILFIDEIDAVGRQRGIGLGAAHDEREQTLNQILVEMDGFDQYTSIVVIAATNRPDVLDPALLRPGRFDRRVSLDLPDFTGRCAILKVHSGGKPLEPQVDLEKIAKQTPGFSGADLENLMNEGAILTARRHKRTIGMSELEEAVDRVVAGPERKSRIISDHEKKIIAYHEAGHALAAELLPHVDPVHKISIIARGISGGHTRLLPTEERRLWTRSQLSETLVFALGGLVAEDLVFGEMTTGPGGDLQQSTEMARRMICEYGMSEKLGPVVFATRDELAALGRDTTARHDYSDETAHDIDLETRRLIDEALAHAKKILSTHRPLLDRIARALIAKETLNREDLEAVFAEAGEKTIKKNVPPKDTKGPLGTPQLYASSE